MDKIIEVKLVTRQSQYQIGHFLDVSLAIRNVSTEPVFLNRMVLNETLKFQATDKTGNRIPCYGNIIQCFTTSPNSFEYLEPGDFLREYCFFYIGTDEKWGEFLQLEEDFYKLDEKDRSIKKRNEAIYSRNLFVNPGDGALECNEPKEISILAVVENGFVLFDSSRPKVKTAVGNVASHEVTLDIQK